MWVMMFVSCMLIPAILATVGIFFSKRAPKNINPLFGYRTVRSMKNRETWEYAHKYFGRIVGWCGVIMLPIVFFIMIWCIGDDDNTVGALGTIILAVECLTLIACIIPTEKALKREFDENGERRKK